MNGVIDSPGISGRSCLIEVRETILLDTTSERSLAAISIRAEGAQADFFRAQFDGGDNEEISRQQLARFVATRGPAKRIGVLRCDYFAEDNRVILQEAFELEQFLDPHIDPKKCQIQLSSGWIAQLLEDTAPNSPEAITLLHPFNLLHVIEIRSPAFQPSTAGQREKELTLYNPFLEYRSTVKIGDDSCVVNLSLQTLRGRVRAAELPQYGDVVKQIQNKSVLTFSLPRGHSRPEPTPDVGGATIPLPDEKEGIEQPLPVKVSQSPFVVLEPAPLIVSEELLTRAGQFPRVRKRKSAPPTALPAPVYAVVAVVLIVLFLVALVIN